MVLYYCCVERCPLLSCQSSIMSLKASMFKKGCFWSLSCSIYVKNIRWHMECLCPEYWTNSMKYYDLFEEKNSIRYTHLSGFSTLDLDLKAITIFIQPIWWWLTALLFAHIDYLAVCDLVHMISTSNIIENGDSKQFVVLIMDMVYSFLPFLCENLKNLCWLAKTRS